MRLAGYASIFGIADSGGDVVRAGAFAREIIAARRLPLLWQHAVDEPIGYIERLSEDGRGLRVVARIAADTRRGGDAAALLKVGAIDGLSFGYRVRASVPDRARGVRVLTDLELLEVSLVTFPMQSRARVIAIQSSTGEPTNDL
ncbi:HK97 family phage prohead protease [Glacieibacterium sp.]|uniref:HK97 family phage prohead protease n=1 Tax=Glacieibacterium sp. TaxID=2860237 RepID=UPI003B00D314